MVWYHQLTKKRRGEGLVYFYHVNDVSSKQRGGGVPHRNNKLDALFVVSAPSARVSNVYEEKSVPTQVRNKEHVRNLFFQWGTPLPLR